ncbi:MULTISPECIES: ABC transporter substrate-binding protein [Cyanophyceae]|uniref:ABC transporter substrate-binding protein n=1 Tax=Cyanophyceae TaxID=3028117 RepID=UPI00016DC575|nr:MULTISPECIES: ABC transporter substrate-binding protein [Cyanophyceae]ACA98640.1 Fe3+ ABC transporter, periplasmic iron-binding protein [Picosynechococcus sp. PCC 7002]SMH40351.1 iron complex transport system substrate-binding protein [Picosynechococcus sp. OG1]SMQ78361.1 iron complex transport system substrate-binding protein [Synechococcus sp. 7002]
MRFPFLPHRSIPLLGLGLSLWLGGCGPTQQTVETPTSTAACVENYDPAVDYFPDKVTPEFARGFQVTYHDHYKVVTVRQPWETAQQDLTYVFVQCGTPIPEDYPGATIVEVPVNRVIALSTTYLPHLDVLGHLENLIGVGDRQLIYSPEIRAAIEAGEIKEVGNLQLDREAILSLQPDVILNYRLDASEGNNTSALDSLGLTVVLDAAHLEPTPLGRAEWLKFTALLFNEEAEANETFGAIANRYQALVNQVKDLETTPTVLSGSPYQGVWYVPGGESYVAQLLRDANVNYPWDATTARLSLPLDFEAALGRAKTADLWLNVNPDWQTTADIFQEDPRYKLFEAVQNQQVYAANNRVAPGGGNDFWEGGTLNPDVILADVIKIAHPDQLPDHELYYYRHLQDSP